MPHKALSFMDNFYLSVLVLRVSYLRCLIYKVHTALSGGSLSYHTVFVLSRTFFRFFNLFRSLRRPGGLLPILLAASAGDSLIVALLVRSVKNFFSGIFRPVSIPSFRTTIQKCTALCRTASICYHAHPGLSSTFFDFFPFFFLSPPAGHSSTEFSLAQPPQL